MSHAVDAHLLLKGRWLALRVRGRAVTCIGLDRGGPVPLLDPLDEVLVDDSVRRLAVVLEDPDVLAALEESQLAHLVGPLDGDSVQAAGLADVVALAGVHESLGL